MEQRITLTPTTTELKMGVAKPIWDVPFESILNISDDADPIYAGMRTLAREIQALKEAK